MLRTEDEERELERERVGKGGEDEFDMNFATKKVTEKTEWILTAKRKDAVIEDFIMK